MWIGEALFLFRILSMANPDLIYIHGLKIHAVLGIHLWEQRIKQMISFDLDLAADVGRAAQSDEVVATINYMEVIACVTEFVANSSFRLLETLAEKVAQLILKEFNINWIRVRAVKVAIVPNVKEVGVLIERSSHPLSERPPSTLMT
jgi:dihydroneopterin aldolase